MTERIADSKLARFPALQRWKSLAVLDATIGISVAATVLGLSFVNGVEKVGSGLLTHFSITIPRAAVLDGESTEGKTVTVYHREPVEAFQPPIDYLIEGYRVTILPISLLYGSGLGLLSTLKSIK